MNRIALAFALILLSTVTAFAAGYEGNPDRYTSFGLDLILGGATGTYTQTASGLSQSLTGSSAALILDGRIPTSDNLTLNLGVAFSGSETKADANNVFIATDQKASSFQLSAGFRYYMH
jgi:hypothetical protein